MHRTGVRAMQAAGIAVVALVVIGLVIALVGSIPRLTDGVVMDKTYSPGRTELQRSGSASDGESRWEQTSQYYPPSWSIRVQGMDKNGKVRAEWWSIGSGLYELIDIGDTVRRDTETGAVSVTLRQKR